jgi:hypothetical protein
MSISGIGFGESLTSLLQSKAKGASEATDVFEQLFEEKSLVQEQQDEKRKQQYQTKKLEEELFDPNSRDILEDAFREGAYGWRDAVAAQLQKDQDEESRQKNLAQMLAENPENPEAPINKLDSDPNPIKSNFLEDLDNTGKRIGRKSLKILQESGEEAQQEVASPLFGTIDSEMDFMEMLDKMDLEKAPEMQENVRNHLSQDIMRKNGMSVPNDLGMSFASTQEWLEFNSPA